MGPAYDSPTSSEGMQRHSDQYGALSPHVPGCAYAAML